MEAALKRAYPTLEDYTHAAGTIRSEINTALQKFDQYKGVENQKKRSNHAQALFKKFEIALFKEEVDDRESQLDIGPAPAALAYDVREA